MLLCGLVFVGGMLLLVFLAPGLFTPLGWGWSSGSYGWGIGPWVWGGFGFPIMGLGMLIFCVLMTGGMMLHGMPFAHGSGSGWMSLQGESLSDILERRYSRGELTKEQFEEMRQTLGVSDAGPANQHAHH
jgi:putative membrane protein